jgi:selenocysteine lyase/cysteine desulfurase
VAAPPAVVSGGMLAPTPHGPVEFANLDHAASTPALVAVADAVAATLGTYASVHRGNGYASRLTSRWYEQARAEVAGFVGARPDDTVVFTRSTTDSWALLAHALPADTTVVVFAFEHHSTLLPWGADRTVTLPIPSSVPEALGRMEAALATVRTANALVVISGASNVTGECWPLAEIAAVVRRHGARLAVDAAQLAPHAPIDLAAIGIDYVAFSGHKLYAPYGSGVLAGRADWLDEAEPYLVGGGAAVAVAAARPPVWATGAARHEGGSPNVIGAVAVAAACAALRRHADAVRTHERRLADRLRTGLAAIPGVRIHSIITRGRGLERVGVVAFTVAELDSSQVSGALSFAHGIGVRDGRFCAHPLTDHLLTTAPQTSAVRASIGLATAPEHVERLLAAVTAVAAQAERARRAGLTWRPPADPLAELDAVRPW